MEGNPRVTKGIPSGVCMPKVNAFHPRVGAVARVIEIAQQPSGRSLTRMRHVADHFMSSDRDRRIVQGITDGALPNFVGPPLPPLVQAGGGGLAIEHVPMQKDVLVATPVFLMPV